MREGHGAGNQGGLGADSSPTESRKASGGLSHKELHSANNHMSSEENPELQNKMQPR